MAYRKNILCSQISPLKFTDYEVPSPIWKEKEFPHGLEFFPVVDQVPKPNRQSNPGRKESFSVTHCHLVPLTPPLLSNIHSTQHKSMELLERTSRKNYLPKTPSPNQYTLHPDVESRFLFHIVSGFTLNARGN